MKKSLIVVDTSVFAKWFLQDEEARGPALELQHDYLKKIVSIALPMVTLLEVNNLLRSSVMRKRIDREQALQIYKRFLGFDFSFYSSHDLLRTTLERAIDLDTSSYDASYVALAEYLQIPFLTADQKLLSKVKNMFVHSLQEYRSIIPETSRS